MVTESHTCQVSPHYLGESAIWRCFFSYIKHVKIKSNFLLWKIKLLAGLYTNYCKFKFGNHIHCLNVWNVLCTAAYQALVVLCIERYHSNWLHSFVLYETEAISQEELSSVKPRDVEKYVREMIREHPEKHSRYSRQAWLYPDKSTDPVFQGVQER